MFSEFCIMRLHSFTEEREREREREIDMGLKLIIIKSHTFRSLQYGVHCFTETERDRERESYGIKINYYEMTYFS